jgi:hypothetical protein
LSVYENLFIHTIRYRAKKELTKKHFPALLRNSKKGLSLLPTGIEQVGCLQASAC